VPVVLRHNETLELNRVEYHGAVTASELFQLAEFHNHAPKWLTFDFLSLILPGANFDAVDFPALDDLFGRYRKMLAPMEFLMMRRSAWLCQSERARAHLFHWMNGRETRDSMSSDVRLLESFEQVGDWLLLNPTELDQLRTGEGFFEVVRYVEQPTRVATR